MQHARPLLEIPLIRNPDNQALAIRNSLNKWCPDTRVSLIDKRNNFSVCKFHIIYYIFTTYFKGVVSPSNNVDWVSRKQFWNSTVNFLANLDNPFKRNNYAKFCMSPSLDRTLPESVISQEKQLSIDFVHRFSQLLIFLGYQ